MAKKAISLGDINFAELVKEVKEESANAEVTAIKRGIKNYLAAQMRDREAFVKSLEQYQQAIDKIDADLTKLEAGDEELLQWLEKSGHFRR